MMGGKADTPLIVVDSLTHRGLGLLKTLAVGSSPILRLTPQEAHTLALALAAVRDGKSSEREIYLSPIASDHGFVALVGEEGVEVTIAASRTPLDWADVSRLEAQLRAD